MPCRECGNILNDTFSFCLCCGVEKTVNPAIVRVMELTDCAKALASEDLPKKDVESLIDDWIKKI